MLVCHRRMFGNSRDGCTTLENLRSTIQGHRDGHTTTHSPQSQATTCRPLCPWMADRPHLWSGSANKERTPLPRAGWSCVSPSLASHPQVFHGGCFGVYGTPPREAVGSVKLGQKPPRSSPRRRTFAYSMAVMVDIRVEGANLLSGHCLVSQNGSSRSLPGGLAPVSIAVDAGVFSCCEGMRRSGRGWVQKGRVMIGVGLDLETGSGKKKKPCCLGAGEQGFLRKTGLWRLGGRHFALLVMGVVYGEPPIAGRVGGHQSFTMVTEVTTETGDQNLSLTLEALG